MKDSKFFSSLGSAALLLIRIVSWVGYCALCLYSALHCLFVSVTPIANFFYTNEAAKRFADIFLYTSEYMFANFVWTLIAGTVAEVALIIIYRKHPKITVPLAVTTAANFAMLFLFSIPPENVLIGKTEYSYGPDLRFLQPLFWLLAIWFLGNIVYSAVKMRKP